MRSSPFGPLRRRLGHAGPRPCAGTGPASPASGPAEFGYCRYCSTHMPAAVVEADAHRLADHRLGGDAAAPRSPSGSFIRLTASSGESP